MQKYYLFLVLAIVAEVIGTSALQASNQFTRLVPTGIMVISYVCTFYFMGLTLKFMPVGIVYAIWSGLGIVLIALIGLVAFDQKLDLAAMIGLSMIVGGVLVIHLFSKTAAH